MSKRRDRKIVLRMLVFLGDKTLPQVLRDIAPGKSMAARHTRAEEDHERIKKSNLHWFPDYLLEFADQKKFHPKPTPEKKSPETAVKPKPGRSRKRRQTR